MEDINSKLLENCNDINSVVKYLDLGADINTVNRAGKSCLHYACMKGDISLVKLLLQRGANVNLTTIIGRTPITYVCPGRIKSNYNFEIVKELLNYEADIHIQDSMYDQSFYDSIKKYEKIFSEVNAYINYLDTINFKPAVS